MKILIANVVNFLVVPGIILQKDYEHFFKNTKCVYKFVLSSNDIDY